MGLFVLLGRRLQPGPELDEYRELRGYIKRNSSNIDRYWGILENIESKIIHLYEFGKSTDFEYFCRLFPEEFKSYIDIKTLLEHYAHNGGIPEIELARLSHYVSCLLISFIVKCSNEGIGLDIRQVRFFFDQLVGLIHPAVHFIHK